MDWCLAYGSLMDPQDASRTLGGVPEMVPVTIQGWQRDWGVASSRCYLCRDCRGAATGQPTALDCIPAAGVEMAAVLVRVDREQLVDLDQRENAYLRQPLDPGALYLWRPGPMPVGRFWIYGAREETRIRDSKDWRDLFLPAPYRDLVLEAGRAWGDEFACKAEAEMPEPQWPVRQGIDFLHAECSIPDCSC